MATGMIRTDMPKRACGSPRSHEDCAHACAALLMIAVHDKVVNTTQDLAVICACVAHAHANSARVHAGLMSVTSASCCCQEMLHLRCP